MKIEGKELIWILLGVTLGLYLMSKPNLEELIYTPLSSVSQTLGLLGSVLMSVTFVLGSRAKFLEDLFGGMDKVLKIHHISGGVSFLMLISHPMIMAIEAIPNYKIAASYFFLGENISYNFGVLALYTMIATLIFTLVIRLPYHIWIKTHDLMGVVLIFAGLHIYLISSDVSRFLPLRLWIFLFLVAGLVSYAYKVFLYGKYGPKFQYMVSSVRRVGNVIEICMQPKRDRIHFRAGQFVFVNFEREGLKEKHPFTVSSSPDKKEMRLSIKALGDHTKKVDQLKRGVDANVWGPYGRFYKYFDEAEHEVVMVAGGIGITPFLSMINQEIDRPHRRKIWLFYAAKDKKEAVYNQEIENMNKKLENLIYFRFFNSKEERISGEVLTDKIGNLINKKIYICGPAAMMDSLCSQLVRIGVPKRNIMIEDFAFKV